jgi:hypothetical protein
MRTMRAHAFIAFAFVACGGSGGFVVEDRGLADGGATPSTDTLTILDVSLAPRDPQGACWSAGSSCAPNPRVLAFVDGAKAAQTEVRPGSFSVDFSESFALHMAPDSTLELVLESASIGEGDIAAKCSYPSPSAPQTFVCAQSGNQLRAAIAAR